MVETYEEDDKEIKDLDEFIKTTDQIEEHLKPAFRKHFIEMFKRRKEKGSYKNDGSANFDRIPVSDAREAAEKYGEGCESLTNLLETCFLNGITTTASCAGHPELEENDSYVSFDITDERTKKLIDYVIKYRLANKIFVGKNIGVETKDGGKKDTMTTAIYVDIIKRDEIYEILEKRIKEHVNDDIVLNPNKCMGVSNFRKIVKICEDFGGFVEYNLKNEKITECHEHLKDCLKKQGFDFDIETE